MSIVNIFVNNDECFTAIVTMQLRQTSTRVLLFQN